MTITATVGPASQVAGPPSSDDDHAFQQWLNATNKIARLFIQFLEDDMDPETIEQHL